jgi:hypothetical protein
VLIFNELNGKFGEILLINSGVAPAAVILINDSKATALRAE